MKHKLNIWTPCGTSFSIITAKTPFSNSPLISLYHKSIKGVSCTRTDISIYKDCLADMPVKLIDMPVKFINVPAKFVNMPIKLADVPTKVAIMPTKVR
jgi:hypothetical protein